MIRSSLQQQKGWDGSRSGAAENSWNHPWFSLAQFTDVFLFSKWLKKMCLIWFFSRQIFYMKYCQDFSIAKK
jgi:hypothetical protein